MAQQYAELFKSFDSDNDGKLTAAQFAEFVAKALPNKSQAELADIIKKAEQFVGGVTLENFISILPVEVVEEKKYVFKAIDEIPESRLLNDDETKFFKDLQKEYADQIKTQKVPDSMLIRFIRGYSKDQDPQKKTRDMLTQALKWRKDNNVDKVMEEKMEKSDLHAKVWPHGVIGYDKNGRPIYCERVGQTDPSSLMEQLTMEELQRFHVRSMEQVTFLKDRLSQKRGVMLYKHNVILDLNGLGMSIMSSSFYKPFKSLIDIDQYYYPETLNKLYMVNAPWIFRTFWAIVKPWIDPATRERILVCGTDQLKELMDENDLPDFLDGKKKVELQGFVHPDKMEI